MTAVRAASRARLHRLEIRPSDDDPQTYVVGRLVGAGFAELPEVGVAAVRLIGDGLTVGEVEERLADGDDRPDVAGLLADLIDLGWVAELDGVALPDPGRRRTQFQWLRPASVGWLFGSAPLACLAALVAAAVVTLARRPELLPAYGDYFWTDYVGLASAVNLALFLAGGALHELMHVAAARSLDLPVRVGLSTRLYNLALQTDVSSAWAVPRRRRYRVYLAGMASDVTLISTALLVRAYAGPPRPLSALLAAYVLVAGLSLLLQANVYMRTDFYFVLLDLARCGDLFGDGLRYARYLGRRAWRAARGGTRPADPSAGLPAREIRAVRIYGPLAVLGSGAALAGYALVGVPVLVRTVTAGLAAVAGAAGDLPRAIDGGLVLVVEIGLLVAFLRTFHRSHAGWFRWIPDLPGRR